MKETAIEKKNAAAERIHARLVELFDTAGYSKRALEILDRPTPTADAIAATFPLSDPVLGIFEHMAASYRDKIGKLARWLVAHRSEFKKSAVEAFLEELRDRGYTDHSGKVRKYSAAGYNAYIFALKRLVSDILDRDTGIDEKGRAALALWLADLKPRKIDKSEKIVSADPEAGKVLSLDELRALVSGAGQKVSLWIEFLVSTGVRVSEMLEIELAQVRPVNSHYQIAITGKGDKERTLDPPRELIDRIRDHFHGSRWLFETSGGKMYRREYVYSEVRRAGVKLLGRPIHPHMMRHSYATRWLRLHPGEFVKLSHILGHSSVKVTLDTYTHETATVAEKNAIYDELRGLDPTADVIRRKKASK